MTSALTGPMNPKMAEDVAKALDRFSGFDIKVTIEVFTGKKPKADPSNAHQPKNAPVEAVNVNGEEVR